MLDLSILTLDTLVRDPQVLFASLCVGLLSLVLAIWPVSRPHLSLAPVSTHTM